MAEYVPECMNIPEYTWINCYDYARVLNIPRYSYNNIIIFVTVSGKLPPGQGQGLV